MLSIFRSGLLGAVTIGVLTTIVVASYILNKQAEATGFDSIQYSLDYVKSKMEVNEESRNNLMMESQTILMKNAYALQQLVEVCPQIINQRDTLATFCKEQGLDEINITDANGVIVASIPSSNEGGSFATYHETQRYLDLITTKNLVIIEKPRPTKGTSYYLENEQFAGVARLDEPGIIQVARKSREYEEFLETASITNVAPDLHIGKEGFILICQDEKIVSADDKELIGKTIGNYISTSQKQNSYRTTINGIKMIAVSDTYKDYEIYGFMKLSEVYEIRNTTLGYILLCNIIVFAGVFLVIMQLIKKSVIQGIYSMNETLEKITGGDLEENVNVHTNAEFHSLSEKINKMVFALKASLKEQENEIHIVTKEKEKIAVKSKEYKEKSQRDALTGLYNREIIKNKMNRHLKEMQAGKQAAFLMIDQDDFKQINDNYGHVCGDFVLERTAKLLLEVFYKDSIIGRLGGDEFCVFFKEVKDKKELVYFVNTFQRRMQENISFEGVEIKVTCSVGAAIAPENGNNWESLYPNADISLYEAKEDGKNCFKMFEQ